MSKVSDIAESKKQKHRAAWSGGLNKEELAKPGGILLAMLMYRANELGHRMNEMAAELGVTYGYIVQLREGIRQVKNVSDEFAKSCALYLGVPRLTVLLAAGKITPEDLFEDPADMLHSLPNAMRFIQRDVEFGGIMPPELLEADPKVQFFVVALYEAATKRKLLPGKVDHINLAGQIEAFNKQRELLTAEVQQYRDRGERTKEKDVATNV
jgi:hypothetical protein